MKNIPTWQDRAQDVGQFPCFSSNEAVPHLNAEISDLRADRLRLIAELEARPTATTFDHDEEFTELVEAYTKSVNRYEGDWSNESSEHRNAIIKHLDGKFGITPAAPVVAEDDTGLLSALTELMSIVRIHSEATGSNFAWAEMAFAEEVIAGRPVAPAVVAERLTRYDPSPFASNAGEMNPHPDGDYVKFSDLAAHPVAGSMKDDADRWQYIKATTTAIRNHETGEREECTPEQFEASVDRLRGANPVAGSPAEAVAWWDRAVGGFYLSEASIPKGVIERGGIVALYTHAARSPVELWLPVEINPRSTRYPADYIEGFNRCRTEVMVHNKGLE